MQRENRRKRNRSPEQASGRQRAHVNAVVETELIIDLQRASVQQLPVERDHKALTVERDHQQLQFTSDCVRWVIPYVPSISEYHQPKEIKFVEYGNEMSCAMKLALCVGQGRNHIFYPDGQPQTEPRDICFYFDAENIQIDEIMETVRRLTGAKVVFEERGEGTSTIAPSIGTDREIIDIPDDYVGQSETAEAENNPILCQFPLEGNLSYSVKRKDIECLAPGERVNEDIIRYYTEYLVKTAENPQILLLHTPFLSSLMSETHKLKKRKPLFNYQFLLLPFFQNEHWMLVIVQDAAGLLQQHTTNVFVLCSLQSEPDMDKFVDFLIDEARHQRGATVDRKMIHVHYPKLKRQSNDYDCGIYMLMFAEQFVQAPQISCAEFLKEPPVVENFCFDEEVVAAKRQILLKLIDDHAEQLKGVQQGLN